MLRVINKGWYYQAAGHTECMLIKSTVTFTQMEFVGIRETSGRWAVPNLRIHTCQGMGVHLWC